MKAVAKQSSIDIPAQLDSYFFQKRGNVLATIYQIAIRDCLMQITGIPQQAKLGQLV